jgi:hypothetical protein
MSRSAALCNQAYAPVERRRLRSLGMHSPAGTFRWMIVDDDRAALRHVVIRGSTYGWSDWRNNLDFEPKDWFEGVSAHRGIHKTAMRLVRNLATLRTDRRIRFTGHSAGGSVAMMAALEMVRTGLLAADAVDAVYAFGSPAAVKGDLGRLYELIPKERMANVMMNFDVVPRAFAHDYSMVPLPILRMIARKDEVPTYDTVGELYAVQPGADWFDTRGYGFHPALPREPGIFLMRDKDADLFVAYPHPIDLAKDLDAAVDYHDVRKYSLCMRRIAKLGASAQ